MADALALVEHRVMHVCTLPGNTAATPGCCDIADEEIAEWCAREKQTLVTIDEDFRGRWVRTGLLKKFGVEVIVFDKDVKGLDEQHRRITLHLPYWHLALGPGPYAYRVWTQTHKNAPSLTDGAKPPKG